MDLPTPSAEALEQSSRLLARIRAEAAACDGWLPFSRYMELALYAPGLGYYSGGAHKFGPAGDFITAPELTPLFGQALAGQVGDIMAASGPSLLEVGAGTGLLAADLLTSLETAGQLPERYAILELSGELRARQFDTLAAKVPHLVSRVEWLDDLPERFTGAVVAGVGVSLTLAITQDQDFLELLLRTVPSHGASVVLIVPLVMVRRSVFRVRWFELAAQTALLTGDGHQDHILSGLERQCFLQQNAGLHVDVLKVQHHGSNHNMDETFTRRISATHYVFGANGDYGNPDDDVLDAIFESRFGAADKRALAAPGGNAKVHFWFSTSSQMVPEGSKRTRFKAIETKVKAWALQQNRLVLHLNEGASIPLDGGSGDFGEPRRGAERGARAAPFNGNSWLCTLLHRRSSTA